MRQEEKSVTPNSTGISLGLLFGVGIGAALKSPSIGIAIGLTLSSVVALAFGKKEKTETRLVFVTSVAALVITISNRVL